MKKYLLILILLFCFESTFTQELSELAKKTVKEALLNKNSLGNYFVVAFPPNDIPNNDLQTMAIYMASQEKAKVKISSPEGVLAELQIPGLNVKTINSTNVLNWNMMLNDNDEHIINNKGIIIESDKAISVYVLSSKGFTSEGYLAIPVKSWGTEYIHCSYWDFNNVNRNWKTGLTVLASEDRTKIEIVLKGRGQEHKTLRGSSIGDTLKKTLNKGQVFMLQGSGETQGEFDLTGSIIKADKPIGIISSHERCMIPAIDNNNGRDHLLAMPPPVSTWGKEYFSLELDRGTDKGDYFRIVAAEDNTEFEAKWYDKVSGEFINSWSGTLTSKGDFDEYSKAKITMPHSEESIRGISYFKANKPIFVMQYAYSSMWDDAENGNYDPFMFPVSNIDQFTNGTIFQTPSNESGRNEYIDNFLNLVIFADAETEQERIDKLNTMMYDGQKLTNLHPELLDQKFPALGTDYDNKLYWVTMEPAIGSHILYGDASFGGYVYGFATFDSYGWPAASGYNDLTILDTIPPAIEVISEDNCGNLTIRLSENSNLNEPNGCDACLPQVDQGFTQIPNIIRPDNSYNWFIDEINYETMTELKENQKWYGSPKLNELDMTYNLFNKREDAKLHLLIPDNTFKNFTEYTYNYYADKLFYDRSLEFIMINVNTTHQTTYKMRSDKNYETLIEEIKVLNSHGEFYKLISPKAPFVIEPKGVVDIVIEYSPARPYTEAEKYDDGSYDLDTLYVKTECIDFSFPIKGYAIDPTSVSTNSDIDGLEIYPNPSSEIINFNSEYNFNRFEVIDLKGNITLEGEIKINSNSINIAKLGNGTYYLRLISDTQSQIGIFQKVK